MKVAFTIPSTALAITLPYLVAKLEGNREEALRLAVEQGLQQGISASALQPRMIARLGRELLGCAAHPFHRRANEGEETRP